MENNPKLWHSEKKPYPFWETLTGKDRRSFLEDSLKLLKSNPAFLEKSSFKQEGYGLRNDPIIYHKIPKFSKINLINSDLKFPLKGEKILSFIKGYFSGDLVLNENPNYGFPGGGLACDFPDLFYIDIENIGSVKYYSGFFENYSFFKFRNIFTSSLVFKGVGNFELNPQENIEKLKKYYRYER